MSTLIAGRYELLREIGRGGMGAVWLGNDVLLRREVALKRVGTFPGADGAHMERVRREARVAAMLNHRHVVTVFDLVDTGDEHWLVMEYVPSRNLGELIKEQGQLTPDETARLIGQAAAALAEAHRVGIVHRDIKPGNMLVTAEGQLKLGDFGIARSGSDPSLTQTGLVTGSPAYLAPEVAVGQGATAASDVWSLGATIFHAVAGHPPYDTGENVLGTLYRVVNEEPPRTDRAGWLAPLLAATMHRDPAGRWSAAQVAAFLEHGPDQSQAGAVIVGTPVAGPDPQSTQIAGAARPAAAAAPAATSGDRQPGRQSGEQSSRRRGNRNSPGGMRSAWPAVLAVLLVIGILAVGAWWLNRHDDSPADNTAGDQSSSEASSPSQSSSEPSPSSSEPADEPTAEGMSDFVRSYLANVTSDPSSTWQQLTPEFQAKSKNFGTYQRFWGTIADAVVSDVKADPESLEVSYHVEYTMQDGTRRPDDVRLKLVYDQGDYLIADES